MVIYFLTLVPKIFAASPWIMINGCNVPPFWGRGTLMFQDGHHPQKTKQLKQKQTNKPLEYRET